MPPPASGTPYTPDLRRTNQFAIFALVTGLVGLVLLAVGFAITALVQAGRRGEKGTGLAIGGLAASAVWALAGAALLAVTLTASPGDDRAGARPDGRVPLVDLDVGDCFTGFLEGVGGSFAKKAPCTRPHDGEVVARSQAPMGVRGSKGEMTRWGEELCLNKTLYLQESRYRKDLETRYGWAGAEASDDREPTLTCVARYTGSAPLTAPLVTTLDTRLKTYDQLSAGDCLDEWYEKEPVTPILSCTEPHRFEVYATFSLLEAPYLDPYPGDEAIDKKAAHGCERRGDKILRKHPDLQLQYLMPSQDSWMSRIFQAVCLASAAHGKLKKSILP